MTVSTQKPSAQQLLPYSLQPFEILPKMTVFGHKHFPFHAMEIYGRVQKGHRKTNTADRHRINKRTEVDVSRRDVPHPVSYTHLTLPTRMVV